MIKIDDLKKQDRVERLAREADKVLGITNALNLALTECMVDAQEVAGAFNAMEDIAKELAHELFEIADEMHGGDHADHTHHG